MKLGIILTPDERSKAYLQKIIKKKIHLDEILFMNDSKQEPIYSSEIVKLSKNAGFDISISVSSFLYDTGINFTEFSSVDINDPELVEYVSESDTDVFIFTGGGILRHNMLNSGARFLHLHPGIVPDYRGSTCFYYSMINEDYCGVTAYFMDEKIDTGDIIYQKKFPKPNHQFVDDVYDAYIRSETLIDVLKNQMVFNTDLVRQNPDDGETYYVIHPVLKHIAILSCL